MVCNTEFLASTDFNPRTHKECDPAGISAVAKTMGISIHALTKSATSCNWLFLGRLPYFNPRTHKECDISSKPLIALILHFNPRTDKECDRSIIQNFAPADLISIHALTKSATPKRPNADLDRVISIHALTKSATFSRIDLAIDDYISIHALTKSATDTVTASYIRRLISIHALTKSATTIFRS